MNEKQKPLVELTEEALTILQRELGTANTIRFLRQFSSGFGDYTAERAAQPDETLDELLDAIKTRRLANGTSRETAASATMTHQQRLDKLRQEYPRAYEKWSEEEDEQLRQEYHAGVGVKGLAALLQRQPSAIESRLQKNSGLQADAGAPKLAMIRMAVERMGLTARAYHCVLKLSRTIADLAGSEQVQQAHVAEALQYRPRGIL